MKPKRTPKPTGRPNEVGDGSRPYSVTLDDARAGKARSIGSTLSEGVRRAIDVYGVAVASENHRRKLKVAK